VSPFVSVAEPGFACEEGPSPGALEAAGTSRFRGPLSRVGAEDSSRAPVLRSRFASGVSEPIDTSGVI